MASSVKCLQSRATAVRSSRTAVVVHASAEPTVDRRALLGAFAAALGAAASLAAPQEASARKIASQAFTGGLATGGGAVPKSSTLASSEGYVLEGYPGTRKPAYIKPEKRQKLLAKARAEAEKVAVAK